MAQSDSNFVLPWTSTVVAVARRPDLWSTALRALRSHARAGWWRSVPPVPAPDPDWIRFRLTTAYGSPNQDTALDAAELIEWLEWLRAWNYGSDGNSVHRGR